MKILAKFYALLFILMLIIIIYTFILFVFIKIKSPLFIFFSIVSLGFLGVSGIQEMLKVENVEYQVSIKRYNTKQEANDALTRGIKLTLNMGFVFGILSFICLLISYFT